MTETRILRTLSEIAAVSEAWTDLHAAARGAPFSSHIWQRVWCETYLDADVEPFVVTLWEDGQMVAAAPFAIRRAPVGRIKRLRLRHLTMLAPDRTGFHDLLVRPGHETCLSQILEVCKTRSGVAYMDLSPMLPNAALETFCTAARADGAWLHRRDEITTAIADLSGDWDAYLARRSKKMRAGIRRNLRSFDKLGIESRLFSDLSPAALQALDDAFAISARSWKAQNGTDIGSVPQHRAYIERLYAALAPLGAMRLLLLYVDGKPASSNVELIQGQTSYLLITDYDDSYAKQGLGRIIVEEHIRAVQDLGMQTYDVLRATHFTSSYCDDFAPYERVRISLRPGLTRWLVRTERRLADLVEARGLKRKRSTGRQFVLGDREG